MADEPPAPSERSGDTSEPPAPSERSGDTSEPPAPSERSRDTSEHAVGSRSEFGDEASITAFRLPVGSLVEHAERYVIDGVVAPEIASAIPEPFVAEVLSSVHEPVLRFSLVGRHGRDVEPIGGWVGPTFSVLALRSVGTRRTEEPDPTGHDVGTDRSTPSDGYRGTTRTHRAGAEPADGHLQERGVGSDRPSGEDDVVPVATEHLPLHLAILLDLGPRRAHHGVERPLELPAPSLTQLLEGDRNVTLPPTLPEPWARVLRSWAASPPRTMSLTVGQPGDPERTGDHPFEAAVTGRRAGSGTVAASDAAGGEPTGSALWRSFTVIDDPAHGLWLVDDEVPAPRNRASVVVAPTKPTTLLDLLATSLRPRG